MKLTIYHFTDLHWIHKDVATEDQQVPYYRELISEFQNLALNKYSGNHHLLAITGDIGNFYDGPNRKISLQDQYEDAFDRLIPVIEEAIPDSTQGTVTKIAVPGNHDVNQKADDKKFEIFDKYFSSKGWLTPSKKPEVTIDTEIGKIRLWLLNSAIDCGKKVTTKIKCPECKKPVEANTSYDPARIGDQKCEHLSNEDLIRIAFLHHNPLPQNGHFESYNKRDVFLDNGNLINRLVEDGFKVVLSGHYHLGSQLFVGHPNRQFETKGTPISRPLHESGFVSLAVCRT